MLDLKLIGKRLIDLLVVGSIAFGISYTPWAIGDNIVEKRRTNVAIYNYALEGQVKIAMQYREDKEMFESLMQRADKGANQFGKAFAALSKAETWNYYFRAASILIACVGVISTAGIVFRGRHLSQKDAFIATWKLAPKYVARYIAGYFKSNKSCSTS